MSLFRNHLVSIVVFLIFCTGCSATKTVIIKQQPVPVQKNFTVLVANSTRGVFEASGCGCRDKGGLSRRASFTAEAKQRYPSVLVLDSGDSLFGHSDRPRANELTKAHYMLAALSSMGIDALNVGVRDCALGIPLLKEKEKKLSLPLVSANLQLQGSGELIFAPYVLTSVQNLKIGIFGLAGTAAPSPRGIAVGNPLTAAQRVVKELREKDCAVVILLSQLSIEENRRIAGQVPGITFIMGADAAGTFTDPTVIGTTALFVPGTKGTHVGVLECRVDEDTGTFYNAQTMDALRGKLSLLKDREQNPGSPGELEDVVVRRALLEQKLQSVEGTNAYRYSAAALDRTVPDDLQVQLLLEKYKQDVLRSGPGAYRDRIATVDLAPLSEVNRLRALRLMNEIACKASQSIAAAADSDFFCRSLAAGIVDGLRKGKSDGSIRYRILYEQGKKKNSLDNNHSP